MTLLAYEPLLGFNRLFNAPTPARERRTKAQMDYQWRPAADIYEAENGYVVALEIPGVNPGEIEITTHNNELVVTGEKQVPSEQGELKRSERVQGKFVRRFVLPDHVDEEAIEAKAEFGVLNIRLPKAKAAQPRKIEIQSA